MSASVGSTNIRAKRKKETPVPLAPGDQVTSYMRPDLTYTVVDRGAHMVLVRSNEDGGESWISRTVLRRVDPAT